MTRALYGKDVRQPIGGDFGFSGRLARTTWPRRLGAERGALRDRHLDDDDRDRRRLQVCQSFLGAKLHDAKDPGADLAAMLVQVVVVGVRPDAHLPRPLVADRRAPSRCRCSASPTASGSSPWASTSSACSGSSARRPAICASCGGGSSPRLSRGGAATGERRARSLRFSRPVVGTGGSRVRDRPCSSRPPGDQLLRSLVPLYLGRTASFVLETAHSDAEQVEAVIRRLASEFVRQKPWLREKLGAGRLKEADHVETGH